MIKKIFLILLFLPLTSCKGDNNCINEEINFILLNDKSFLNVCNYNEKALSYTIDENIFNMQFFYKISKLDKNTGIYILRNIDTNTISSIEKAQIYYTLKEIYGYNNSDIFNLIGPIDNKFTSLNLNAWRSILAENMLTINYGETEFDFPPEPPIISFISYDEIVFLKYIFELEPQRFDSINLVSSLRPGYDSLKDEKSKVLYVEIMQNLLLETENITSKQIINSFLEGL